MSFRLLSIELLLPITIYKAGENPEILYVVLINNFNLQQVKLMEKRFHEFFYENAIIGFDPKTNRYEMISKPMDHSDQYYMAAKKCLAKAIEQHTVRNEQRRNWYSWCMLP